MLEQSKSQWFALRVKPRHEKSVAAILESKNFEHLLPQFVNRKKWADRYKNVSLPLFPGYVFSRFEFENRGAVLRSPGVVDLVRFGEVVLPINPTEIEAIQTLMKSGLPCEPHSLIAVGDKVEICGGPFFGHFGTVAEVRSKLRLVLSVTLLNRSVLVDMDRDWVRSENQVMIPRTAPVSDAMSF